MTGKYSLIYADPAWEYGNTISNGAAAVPGCQTCADCQSVIELKNKQRGIQ